MQDANGKFEKIKGLAEMEQHRFQTVIKELDAAVFEWDLKNNQFYCSEAYQKYALSRISNQDILNNRGSLDTVHPEDVDSLQKFFQETCQGKARVEVVLRLKLLDGTYRWCRMIGFFYKDAEGNPSHTVGVIIDINDEHEQQVQLQKLIDEVPTGIGIYEINDGQIELTYLNEAYYSLLGTTRENRKHYYGMNAMNAIHEDDRNNVVALAGRLIAGEEKGNVLHRVHNAQGKWVWLNLTASVVERRDKHLKVYAAFSDCNEIMNMQQELQKNRRREQALMSSIPGGVAIYRLKKDGRVTTDYVSEGLAKMCGYEYAEFIDYIKNNAMVNVPQEEIPIVIQAAQKSIQNHSAASVIYHIHVKEQPDILIRLDANFIEEIELEEDDMAVWYALHTKVSDDSQLALKEQKRYRTIMDALDMAFIEWERDKGFYASEKYAEYAMSEQSHKDIPGNYRDSSIVHPDDKPVLLEFFANNGQHHAKNSAILRMKMRDGSYRWTEILGFSDLDEKGNVVRVIGILRDIDKERIEQNERLQKAFVDAQKANAAKTDFLSRVSHDMRTPLNGILGLTSLMQDRITEEDLQQDLSQMELAGKYLLNLINDTLDVSRIESGNVELHPSVCDSRSIINSVITLVKPTIDAKNIHINIITSGLSYPMLYIDVGRVEQIMMNILGNAAKFTPVGGHIKCYMKNISIENGIITDEICIWDDGIGMSKDFLPRIFEPFAQEDSTRKNSNQGTGLGMIITKQLVELMGGSISVESEPGKGTCVTFTLVMPIATQEQIANWKASQKTSSDNHTFSGKKVLLCEDHPLNAKIARRLLEKKGIIVEHAENGEIGLNMFKASAEGYYDAVLMDIRMPVMDGIEATIAMRNLPRADAAKIPIIAMTANAFFDDVQETKKAGMNAHLSKPIQPEILYRALEEEGGFNKTN